MAESLRFRQIHLDFHTGPAIPDVGCDFNAAAYAATLERAHVNSVTTFAKCHHGHLYYATKHPARHPGLKPGLDLLGEQIEACHRRNIKVPIYVSVQCDEYAATAHPEWRAVNQDGTWVGGPLQATWHILDMASPYQDYLAEQLAEILRRFKPLDGLFLDMCWDQPSCSTWVIAGMLKAGLNPDLAADRQTHAHAVAQQYMARYKQMVDAAHRGRAVKLWFNSRPLTHLPEEKKYVHHVEIEALATGGWGYLYFPLNVRFARTFGLPTIGMTARFHKSWADFGGFKPAAALLYECTLSLAHGARCSVGDQMHPRGRLDRAAYDLIGQVYGHVEACEPWCAGAAPVTEIAVIRPLDANCHPQPGDANEGVVRALQQLRHQFDFVPAGHNLAGYRVALVPESVTVDPALQRQLAAFAKAGGAILFAGAAGVAAGRPVLAGQGVTVAGESPFQTTYLRFDGEFAAGVAAADHVMYERGLRLQPAAGARGYVKVVEPYFDRDWRHFSSHFQTPPARVSRYVAVVRQGRIVTVAFPIFKAYATHGNLPYRQLIANCLEQLLPAPLLRVGGPSFLEATVTAQPKRTVVHLLAFCPQRRAQNLDLVEEPTDVRDLPVSLRLARAPRRVTCQPTGEALPFVWRAGRADVVLPRLLGHALLVFE